MTHTELAKRAATWLRNHGAVIVCTEVVAWQCAESPDVIGWGYDGISYMVEAKVSRADFLADKAKPHRNGEQIGLGNYRYYAAPAGMIRWAELPDSWGLIETSGAGMRLKKAATCMEAHDQREKVLLVQLARYQWQEHWRQQHNVDVAAFARRGWGMRRPAAVMGTIYIGPMQLQYDVSGGTVLRFSNGLRCIFTPDFHDVNLYVQAEAMGYGRQIGQLVRDRILMHCLLATIEDTEPWYLATDTWSWPNRVDMLVCHLNQVACFDQPYGPDEIVLVMAHNLLHGGGIVT